MAKKWNKPPAEIAQIDDPWAAWCINECVYWFEQQLKAGRKIAPKKTENNDELLKQFLQQ